MKITTAIAKKLGKKFNINYTKTPFKEFVLGLKTELEHIDILGGNYDLLTMIVMAHLRENPRYYFFLEKAGL
jgi:hypothetical protein